MDNPYVILILGIWLINAIACFSKKNNVDMIYATVSTILIGIGYLILHDK